MNNWTRQLYQSIKNILLSPLRDTLPPIAPANIDDDVQFHEDMRYLESLADTILDDTRLARIEISDDIYADYVALPLLEMASRPIESEAFWRDWDWDDHAGALLSLWRMDRDMETFMGAPWDRASW